MKRLRIRVAYDGTNYCGWQIQPNGITIEQVLNETLSQVLHEDIKVTGASRTDSGVHSLGNVAVFDTNSTIPADKLAFAINPHLPEDVRIVESEQVADDFHPRFCDSRKTYEYHIENKKFPTPTKRLYTHLVTRPLDVKAMQAACPYIVGTHDFKAFCASKTQAQTTVRTVNALEVVEKDGEIVIRVTGEGFLYNMVRIITGTLIKVGLHVYPPEYVKEIVTSCDRSKAGETVPAKGLLLYRIEYL